MPTLTKTCARCGKEKPLTEFTTDSYKPDGYDSYCRQCRRALWRKKHDSTPRLLARFTTEELEAEIRRRTTHNS